MRELVENRGRQFDPHLVEIFLKMRDGDLVPRSAQPYACPPAV